MAGRSVGAGSITEARWRAPAHPRGRSGGRAAVSDGAEAGFTLIELMVVLLIMAILIAIAVPTMLGVRTGSQDRSVQSDLTNAAISASSLYTANDGTFNTAAQMISQLESSEPELTFVLNAPVSFTPAHQISVSESLDMSVMVMAIASPDQRCWYVELNEEGVPPMAVSGLFGVTFNQGVSYAGTTAGTGAQTSCAAQDSHVVTHAGFSGWQPSFPS